MVTVHDERRFFSRLIRMIFVLVSLATVLALLSPLHWFAELFSHFRFYYLLVQAVLALIFLHSGRRALMACTVLLALPNAWYVGPYLTPLVFKPSVAADMPREPIDVIALNVNYRNAHHQAVRTYLRSSDADIIVLAEVTDEWRSVLSALDAEYPHQVGRARPDPWGLYVYSRHPFIEAELLDLGVPGSVNARIVIDSEAGPVQLYAVHLHSPMTATRAALRNTQLAELARQLAAAELPSAVVGDLNVTPFSPYFENLLKRARVTDARRASGIDFTWPTHPVPLWIPIDHALAHPSLILRDVRRGPNTGSDHYPLELSLACCAPETG